MDISTYVRSNMKAEALKTPFSNQTASFYIFIKSEQQAERMNCTLMAAIRSFIDPKQTNWEDYNPFDCLCH